MRTILKKTLLAGLPLAGLLAIAPAASAHDPAHREIHRDLGRMHEDFHQMPHSRWEHRQFHREMKREHRALDRSLRDGWGRDGSDRYGYGGQPYYGGGYDDPSRSDRYGYGNRGDYGDDYDPSGRYGYGDPRYYDGASPYGGPYSPDSLPALLGPALGILLPR